MNTLDQLKTACECCEGIRRLTPAPLYNRPGLPALAYRVGTQARFKTSMLAGISQYETLCNLTTRKDEDVTIALVDSWAVVLDVLSFYQERIANEAFFRTATLRESILLLARLLGYELNPGVAASVLLAFELDSSKDSPIEVNIPARTPAQSIPVKEETPQTFETAEDFLARPGWNALTPRLTQPHPLEAGMRQFFVLGVATNLKLGDPMLLATGDDLESLEFLRVVGITADAEQNRTQVDLDVTPDPPQQIVFPVKEFEIIEFMFEEDMTISGVVDGISGNPVSTQTLGPVLEMGGLSIYELAESMLKLRTQPGEPPTPGGPGLYALRISTAPFGHNAPAYLTTPAEWRDNTDGPFTNDWDAAGGWPVTKTATDEEIGPGATIRLEQYHAEILADSWAVLEGDAGENVYLVQSATQESVADFGLSGKATRLSLADPNDPDGEAPDLSDYKLRSTAIHTASEILELAPLPIDEIAAGSETLELEEIVPDLLAGHRLIIFGQRTGDYDGVDGAEEVELKDVLLGVYTTLVFTNPLQYGYKRDTVKIYANVVEASHGETVEEVMGSGDGAQALQAFKLRKPPLTYVSAPVPSGGESTLEVRVNGVLWHEGANPLLFSPEERSYLLRRDNDGNTSVHFGDGVRGARLPTGLENVTARYRSGIGSSGLVDGGRIALLPVKPLGLRGVTNPIASGGAQDPEILEDARQNAPLTVLTLERIVSLQDFEDFARAFSGIDKAQAAWVWSGGRRVVHVTVAGPDGNDVPEKTLEDLIEAMDKNRVPHQQRVVAPFRKVFFTLSAKIKVHADYEREPVFAEVSEKLQSTFAFDAREFGQRVTKSEVLAVIQSVSGVEAVDLDSLEWVTGGLDNAPDEFGLPAFGARYDQDTGEIHAAQLLLIAATPVDLEEML
jgi:hypothetical protein